jgi:hypothetical protein
MFQLVLQQENNMMDFDAAVRVARLQELVKWGTMESLKEDGHHKSSEGYMEIGYCLPPMFSDDQRPYWQVKIYSYVLGPSRMHSWTGKTLDAALALAEAAVEEWTEEHRMRAFSRDMGKLVPPEDDIEDEIPELPK